MPDSNDDDAGSSDQGSRRVEVDVRDSPRGPGRRAGPRVIVDLDYRTAATWPEVMYIPDIAAALRLDGEVIRKHLRDGVLPGRKIGGTWMISKTRLLAYLDEVGDAEASVPARPDHTTGD